MNVKTLWKLAKNRGFGLKAVFRFGGPELTDKEKLRRKKRGIKMKKGFGIKMMMIVIALTIAAPATAGIVTRSFRDFVSRYEIRPPDEIEAELKGFRNMKSGQWLTGYGADFLAFKRKDQSRPIVYLAANHLFNMNEEEKGSLGLSIGLPTGKAGEMADKVLRMIAPGQADRFEWFGKLGNFVSFEVDFGYKFFGATGPGDRFHYGYGGKLKIPVNKFFDLFRRKK